MEICVINDRFSTELPGGAYRIQGIGLSLGELGHRVTYVCPKFATDDLASLPDIDEPGSFADWYLGNLLQVLRQLRGIEYDVYLVELPFPIVKVLPGLLKSLIGRCVFFDFGEYWLEARHPIHRFFADTLVRISSHFVTGISVATKGMQAYLGHFLGFDTTEVYYLPCGVDINAFNRDRVVPMPLPGLEADSIIVGYMGTISKTQGCDLLPSIARSVCKRVPKLLFLIVGEGPFLGELESKVKLLGLADNFVFATRVARADLPRYVARMDIGLSLKPVSSRPTFGSFPQKVPEYMAMGCIPLSTPIAEVRNVIKNSTNGIIVSADRMAEIIASLAEDDGLRQDMSREAVRFARLAFDQIELTKGLLDYWMDREPRLGAV